MSRTRLASLGLLVLGSLAASWLLLKILEGRGVHLAAISWAVPVLLLVLAVAVFCCGLVLRAYRQGRRPGLKGPRAAQLVMWGKAASHAGALLIGWYGAQGLLTLPLLQFEAQSARALTAGAATVTAVILAVAGLATERFGELPPPQDGPSLGEAVGHDGSHD